MVFSQYCSFCEKLMDIRQMNSLYCSDACKQADGFEEKKKGEKEQQTLSQQSHAEEEAVRRPISIQTTTTTIARSYRTSLLALDDEAVHISATISTRPHQSPRSIDLVTPTQISPHLSPPKYGSPTLQYEKKIVSPPTTPRSTLQHLLEKRS